MGTIDDCARRMPAEPLTTCLGYRTLSQKKLYKAMEDHAYVYRSIYVEHLQSWLRFYPPSQLLVLPSESLFADATRAAAMAAFATFLGLPATGVAVDPKVLSRPRPPPPTALPTRMVARTWWVKRLKISRHRYVRGCVRRTDCSTSCSRDTS